MFDKLEDLLIRFEEVLNELNEPTVANNQARFQKLMKEQSDLQPIVDAYKEYKDCKQTVEDSVAMLEEENDEEMREMLKEELSDAKKRIEELERELKILLLPKDPNDDKNVIVEIRAGAGGDEAALFAAEIYRMYKNYAESKRWKTEFIDVNENGIGGFKEVSFMINGQGAYSRLKYESGVHRVQRIPATESGGRIHTSTITVAIMPEAEEVDVQLDMNDCRFDVFRASGNGGFLRQLCRILQNNPNPPPNQSGRQQNNYNCQCNIIRFMKKILETPHFFSFMLANNIWIQLYYRRR